MNDEKIVTLPGPSNQNIGLEDVHYRLIVHIREQNQTRSHFLPNISFGEPIWDFLLDLLAAEYLNKSASILAISKRLGLPESLCQRCANYLLSREAIFENRNNHSSNQLPFLVSQTTKVAVRDWLNDCMKFAMSPDRFTPQI